MAGFPDYFCGIHNFDALDSARRRRSNLNVAILQRRVSARGGCGKEIRPTPADFHFGHKTKRGSAAAIRRSSIAIPDADSD